MALEAVDDQVTLLDGRPIGVDSLWRTALGSLRCADCEGIVVVHPSWWPRSRVGVVSAAARAVVDDPNDVVAQPRSWLLARAAPEPGVFVEISERMVVVSDGPGGRVVGIPRGPEPEPVIEEVAGIIAAMTGDVLIDGPGAVVGAQALAVCIAAAVRRSGACRAALPIDDAGLVRLARAAPRSPAGRSSMTNDRRGRSRTRDVLRFATIGVAFACAVPAFVAPRLVAPGHQHVATLQDTPGAFLVEGRVALTVPANWSTQRLVAGPGSARVQVTSPADPEVALHITQSPVPGETLTGTADRLKRAIDGEPAGVFVDFNPSGTTAGRPAVTYREVRAVHQVRWTVLVDGSVRISLGCQSRPGDEEAVRAACEQAVRSAHAVG